MNGQTPPSPITLLKNADACLELLHHHPEQVQPLRFTDMRTYRELLFRIAARVEDLRGDLDGGRGE